MRTDAVETFVDRLAARVPAPGGGATAALHAAQAAAIAVAGQVLGLAERLAPIGNRTVTTDVAAASVTGHAAALTPLPGGVGPVTTALLLRHTIQAARSQPAAPLEC